MSGGIEHEPTIAGRVGRFGRQYVERAGQLQQRAQRFGANKRHIAVQHEDARLVGNRGHGLQNRVPGALLCRLLDPAQIRLVGECRFHLVAAMAEHDMDAGGRQFACGSDYMRQHRSAGDPVQHLRQGGLHPLAFAGGEDDHVQGRKCIHGFGGSGLSWGDSSAWRPGSVARPGRHKPSICAKGRYSKRSRCVPAGTRTARKGVRNSPNCAGWIAIA